MISPLCTEELTRTVYQKITAESPIRVIVIQQNNGPQ